jgi:zinc D-Ala-D-Ala carboxypeptidase
MKIQHGEEGQMKRSKHFSSHRTECPCCGFDNVRAELLVGLEELRKLSGYPIDLGSGTRCPTQNKLKDGSPGSYHMKGKAADVSSRKYKPKDLAKLAEQVEVFSKGGIGIYPSHIHVDIGERVARWNG